jgi:hypothetical protein
MTCFCLVPRLRMIGALPPLPECTCMALTLTTLPLPLLLCIAGFFVGKTSHIHSNDNTNVFLF